MFDFIFQNKRSRQVLNKVTFLLLTLCGQIYAAETQEPHSPPPQVKSIIQLDNTHVLDFQLNVESTIEEKQIRFLPQLKKSLSKYRNKRFSSVQLHHLAQTLTRELIELGYVNSGVLLKDQTVKSGIIEYTVIPGRLSKIIIDDPSPKIKKEKYSRKKRNEYIVKHFEKLKKKPLNLNEVQTTIQQISGSAMVKQIHAELKPTPMRGRADLFIELEDDTAHEYRLSISNHVSPNLGGKLIEFGYTNHNLSFNRDSLAINIGLADGLERVSLDYSRSPGSPDSLLKIQYDKSKDHIVSEPFDELGIENETSRFKISIEQNISHNRNAELLFSAGLIRQENTSFFFGEELDYPDHAVPPSETFGILFGQQWLKRGLRHIFVIHSQLELGQTSGGTEDFTYNIWRLHNQWFKQFDFLNSQLKWVFHTTLANKSMPYFRRAVIGGSSSVRGFRESLITRDNNIISSLNWQLPIGKKSYNRQMYITPFIDFGSAWQNASQEEQTIIEEDTNLTSIGIQFDWSITDNVSLSSFLAIPVQKPKDISDEMHDNGFGFQLKAHF